MIIKVLKTNQKIKIFKKGCVKDGKYNKYFKIWKY